MLDFKRLLCLVAVLVAGAVAISGCTGQNNFLPTAESQASANWQEGLDEEVVAALSQLSSQDRTVALAQNVYPVTGEPLGSMGTPPKVTLEGQDVFLCCASCEEELKSDPAKYLAKLNEDK